MACGFGLALRSLLYHIQSRSARFATFQQFSSLVSVAQNEDNFPVLRRLLGSSRKSCALSVSVCVCVRSRPPTPKQHCAYLLNCLSSSSTKSSGLFWLLGFEMCRLWQTCGISPVLLGKTCLSDCGNSVGLLHHFIHTSFLPFGEVRGLNPPFEIRQHRLVCTNAYTRYLLHSRHLKFYIF